MLPGKRYTPEDYLRLAWRHRVALTLIPLIVLTITSVFALRLPDQYRSETTILVVPQRVPSEYVKATVTATMQDRLPAISQQILSRTRLEQIVTAFELYPEIRQAHSMEDAIARMRQDIDIEIVRGESFRVAYRASDPGVAMRVTERLAAFFIEENLRDREVMASGTSAFLESQLEDARRRLVEHEKRIEEYRRTYSGELPSQLQSNLQTIQNKQFQLQSLREALNRDRDRKVLLERQLADLAAEPLPVSTAPAGQPADSADPAVQLEVARNTLKAMEVRLTPDHPDVIRLKRLIASLEQKVQTAAAAEPADESPAPASASPTIRARARAIQLEIDNLSRQIAFQEREADTIQSAIAQYQRRVEVAPTRESQIVALTRDYDTLQTMYRTLLAKREDSKIAENLERRQIGEQFKVLDPARRPERPASPDRLMINAVGAGVGVALAVGLIVLLEYRDRSLCTEEDVRLVLQQPLLAVVPRMTDPAADRMRRAWRIAWTAGAAALILGCAAVLSQTLRAIR